jgi:hypothetical protein
MLAVYREKETRVRKALEEMPTSEEIAEMLKTVGLKMNDFYGLYSLQKICDAVLYAKELKDRYTVLWMYYDLFGNEPEILGINGKRHEMT